MHARHPLLAFFAGLAPVLAAMVLWRPEAQPLPAEVEVRLHDAPRWVALVGGAEPASTQVSLAQDAELIRRSLGDEGTLLFGGGTGTLVQVRDEDATPRADLRARLADLFDPRDRAVRYVPGPEVDGPASPPMLFGVLDTLRGADAPFTWVLAGHGEGGEAPIDSVFHLWGGEVLGVTDLASELDALGRPARLVVTSCFGGGFADTIFVAGESERGLAEPHRCGVFATSYDREASGCDPDPTRARQESYAIHFWHALRGEDREGHPVDLDLDGDGTVGLLEAHTHARVASRSLDVPTTTSERWLAHAVEIVDLPEVEPDLTLPELAPERRVIEALGAALDARNEEEARRRVDRAEHVLENEEVALAEIEARVDSAFYPLRIALLEVLPIADDPWHPELDAGLVREGARLRALLDRSEEGRAYSDAVAALGEAHARVDDARVEAAVRWRLLQAWDTARLASALRAHGGPTWDDFVALRRCENGR
ncbi:MAG: hypothetical protein H6721_23230 [Sandaracinus sp.]|nr:hypothetical protein [Sandaracinus sp.]